MDSHDYVTEYAEKTKSGEILAPKSVISIFSMLADEIQDADQGGRWVFDPAKGNRPKEFARRFLKHTKGKWAGQAVCFELWQAAISQAVFGFYDRDGNRRFHELALLVPRKCGKSTIAAVWVLYGLLADNEQSAEIYCLASTYKQAFDVIFTQCFDFVRLSPSLNKRLTKRKYDLYDSRTRSKLEPLAAMRPDALDGKNAHMAVLDEAHAITNLDLWSTMRQSVAARSNPIIIVVSSAGRGTESLYMQMRTLGLKVANGEVPLEHYLPVIYEASAENWESEEEWFRANPSLSSVKSLQDMREKFARAQHVPTDAVSFKAKDLGIQALESSLTWLEYADLQKATTETWSIEDFRGFVGVCGVDLSLVGDLTSACVLLHKGDTWYCHSHLWLPAQTLEEHTTKDKIPYPAWIEQGYVSLSYGGGGSYVDHADVQRWFESIVHELGISISFVAYDPWGSRDFVRRMEEESGFGRDGSVMVPVRQGSQTLSAPFQQLTAEWKSGLVQVDNPCCLWTCSNVTVEQEKRNQTWLPAKARGRMRTDGFSALLCAYVVASEHLTELKRWE